MQAITVLLLELTQGTSQLSEDTSEISASVEKLTQWLSIMKTVDGVAERAYIVVCEMLSKNHQFTRQMVPSPWLDEIIESNDPGSATFTNVGYQSLLDPNLQDLPENLFGNHPGTATQDDTLDPNNLGTPLNDPLGNFQYGQPQYQLFYGNQFTTFFDQNMGYGLGDDEDAVEQWDPLNQQPR